MEGGNPALGGEDRGGRWELLEVLDLRRRDKTTKPISEAESIRDEGKGHHGKGPQGCEIPEAAGAQK